MRRRIRFSALRSPVAAIPRSGLASAGAELFIAPHVTFIAKFDGEFAPGSRTYAGGGTLRYSW